MFKFLRRKKKEPDLIDLLIEYIAEARKRGFRDKDITENMFRKGYDMDSINIAFKVNDLKGGTKMAKRKDKEEYDEDDEDEDEYDDEDEDEPIKKTKQQKTTMERKRASIGEIKPLYQQVGFEVFKGTDDNGEEKWTPCEKISEAETLSLLYRK